VWKENSEKENEAVGKVYKNKKSGGCSLCKPHKHKKADKLKPHVREFYRHTDQEIKRAESGYLPSDRPNR